MGRLYADTSDADFLPTLVSKIQRRRGDLGEGQWLSEELRISLEEMAPILERAELTFELVRGLKNTIIIKPVRTGGLDPSNHIEAYSLKMMVSCLKNPSNQFLSLTLDQECRQARRQLIDNLRETYLLLLGPEAANARDRHQAAPGLRNRTHARHEQGAGRNADVSDPAGDSREPAFLAALRKRKEQERRARLLESVLEMSTATRFRERNEAAFRQIFEGVWQQVRAGSLPESIAAGKILDRIYAQRARGPVGGGPRRQNGPGASPASSPGRATETGAAPGLSANRAGPSVPFVTSAAGDRTASSSPMVSGEAPSGGAGEPTQTAPSSVSPGAPAPPGFAAREPMRDPSTTFCRRGPEPQSSGVPAGAPSPPATGAVRLPAMLDTWVGQGLTAHRIFRDLLRTSDLKKQVRRWTMMPKRGGVDVQYLLILHVLNSVTKFSANEETVTVPMPLLPKMGFEEFEKLIDEGKANGAHDIDPRIWGVIGGVYSFLKNSLGPQLGQR
jgi:hypothetical protein